MTFLQQNSCSMEKTKFFINVKFEVKNSSDKMNFYRKPSTQYHNAGLHSALFFRDTQPQKSLEYPYLVALNSYQD